MIDLEKDETLEIEDTAPELCMVALIHHNPDYNCAIEVNKNIWNSDKIYRERWIHFLRSRINDKIKEDTK